MGAYSRVFGLFEVALLFDNPISRIGAYSRAFLFDDSTSRLAAYPRWFLSEKVA